METIITIKKNKPVFKAPINLAKELEKTDPSILVSEHNSKREQSKNFIVISPKNNSTDITKLLNEVVGFPTLKQLRKKVWPEISL